MCILGVMEGSWRVLYCHRKCLGTLLICASFVFQGCQMKVGTGLPLKGYERISYPMNAYHIPTSLVPRVMVRNH